MPDGLKETPSGKTRNDSQVSYNSRGFCGLIAMLKLTGKQVNQLHCNATTIGFSWTHKMKNQILHERFFRDKTGFQKVFGYFVFTSVEDFFYFNIFV